MVTKPFYKNMKKGIATLLVFVFSFSFLFTASATKAFYLEVPEVLKTWFKPANAQDEQPTSIAPAPPVEGTIPGGQTQPYLQPFQPMNDFNQPSQTCNINGKEMPGPCSNYNQQPGGDQPGGMNFMPQQYGSGQPGGMNFAPQQPPMMQQGPNQEEMQKQNEERRMKDMLRGVKQMEMGLKKFESMVKSSEKQGTIIPQEIKDQIIKARTIIEAIKNAKSNEELEVSGSTFDDLNEIMQNLEQSRQEIFENAQRLKDVKRMLKSMTTGVKMFDRQIAKLIKQKISIPEEISTSLSKVKTIMEAVKNAKIWDEAETAGVEDLQESMMDLDQSRDQLEMLSRWPQTLKRVNSEITRLDRELKKSKAIVDRLLKKEIDLSANYAKFADEVAKLKTIRDEAVAKIKTGDLEGFDDLENNFFSQLDDIYQSKSIIDMMNNLGRFNSNYKTGLKAAQNTIRRLEKKEVDATELKELLNQIKIKGDEIVALIKAKEIDEDSIIAALEEFELSRQDFDNKAGELGGEEGVDMPWEQGPQVIKPMQMPSNFSRLMPIKKAEPQMMEQQPMEAQPLPPIPVQTLPAANSTSSN